MASCIDFFEFVKYFYFFLGGKAGAGKITVMDIMIGKGFNSLLLIDKIYFIQKKAKEIKMTTEEFLDWINNKNI